jgi:hypothetical protein
VADTATPIHAAGACAVAVGRDHYAVVADVLLPTAGGSPNHSRLVG